VNFGLIVNVHPVNAQSFREQRYCCFLLAWRGRAAGEQPVANFAFAMARQSRTEPFDCPSQWQSVKPVLA
jgi:hypothetical protein